MQVRFLIWEDPPGGRNGNPTPGFLPGESHGQRSLVGYSPLGHKESGSTERLNHNKGAQERRKVRGREVPLGVRNQPGNREETS